MQTMAGFRGEPTAGHKTPKHRYSIEKNKNVDVLRELKIEFRNAECIQGKQECVQECQGKLVTRVGLEMSEEVNEWQANLGRLKC